MPNGIVAGKVWESLMIGSYLNILEDSLIKKRGVLDDIQKANEAQTELLKNEKLDVEQYDKLVDQKDDYIRELEKLDEGFESLYESIKQELVTNQELYADQIKRIQELIGQITDRSVSIQAQEARNRDMVTAYFSRERKALGEGRRSSKVAYGYYQNLNKARQEESRILDTKQ